MRDLNPRDFHLRVFETRALGRYANPPGLGYAKIINVYMRQKHQQSSSAQQEQALVL